MNPLFQNAVDALFAKLSFLQDPQQVADTLRAQGRGNLPGEIERGQGLIDAAKRVGSGTADVAAAAGRGLGHVLAPAQTEGKALFKELGSLGGHLGHPSRLPLVVGGLALAPILASAVHAPQQRREDDLMNRQMNPAQSKLSHLDVFLEKKMAAHSMMDPVKRTFNSLWTGTGGHVHDSFASGLGQGVGGGVAKAILGAFGDGLHSINDALIVDPQRKRLFESIVRTDPVISDAVSRNPHAGKTLVEAFQTMVRFAPSLSSDVNAVRSFLREAVIGGGGGVNYATIKTLIETEKGLNGSGDRR